MKKRRKIKKQIKYIFILLAAIILSYTSIIYIYIYIYSDTKATTNNQQEDPIDTIDTALQNLNYSKEEITLLKKELSTQNITYLIDNQINHTLAYNIIKETYYIDNYLEKYINYYQQNQELEYKEIITHINTHLDNEFYTNTEKTDDTLGKFVILNKHYYADESYEGEDLIEVDASYNLYGTTFKLSRECYEAFLKMYEDAKNAGYGFKINSAYRSYTSQVKIYQGWVNKDGQALADTYSARAGYSEHQTGYAFDVRDYPFTNDDYSKTRSFTWVKENAYKYGFILRFPENKEYITGYQYEPWHYRYCGIECATYIYNNDITFEEYYEYFIKYGNPRNLK